MKFGIECGRKILGGEAENYSAWVYNPHEWFIRRKVKFITVNGFQVPEPLDTMPKEGEVYNPFVGSADFYEVATLNSTWAKRCIERKIAHSTKEAAIMHAKALLGINPKTE